ncbi:MAG: potassium-transporting ATPase subunit KdpA, partial [Bacteroidales bacterium]
MNEVIQILLFMIALVALAPLLGKYMAKVFMGENHFMKPVFGWLEKSVYRLTGIKSDEEMNWKTFTYGVLLFNLFGMIFLFLLQMLQAYLPLNTEK